jgi:hypothetical protein
VRGRPCINREKEERRNLGRKRGERAGEPESKTPRLRLSRLFDLLVGVIASAASSTEETEEERSRWRRNSAPPSAPQDSAGVVGTEAP